MFILRIEDHAAWDTLFRRETAQQELTRIEDSFNTGRELKIVLLIGATTATLVVEGLDGSVRDVCLDIETAQEKIEAMDAKMLM